MIEFCFYIIGCIATIYFFFYSIYSDHGSNPEGSDILWALVLGLTSWVGLVALFILVALEGDIFDNLAEKIYKHFNK